MLKRIQQRWRNITATLYNLFIRGVPVVLFKFDRVFKIGVSPVAVKRLNREVCNSNKALQWDIYANKVVPLKKIAPFTAVSTFIDDEGKENHMYKYSKLIDFFMNNFVNVLGAPKVFASEIITSQITNLEIDLSQDHPAYSKLKQLINSDYLTFQLPMTPMHGDISSLNLVIEDETLRLIDFELAMHSGSILYDWWCLKKRIHRDSIEKKKTFYDFIEKALDKLDLSGEQFNVFGYTMFSISSISGFEANKFHDLEKSNKYINRSLEIIASQEDLAV